ncbi:MULTISPECIES: GNAT family N-acetyltransferase [unclassified Bacillus (in: firmicutes)]|uniref:GNAT family N-acetyltransferase n=1 Tax=unclassified Bacillus (in: firmicutes) TaxID=185979 RepID=UPI00227EA971|nr:GNAT family N-acetyltransferase [Bacillus sp. S20C3]MCY8287679.1 GNAT family N-acetyltransferase [Bacillus sp. N13C7]MCY8639788.1 GNAT family N-acetyltransferase [Bacillus sp. S17B2]MCY8721336.1 GNAT family N-acetyltransferase [Bacillus sp. S10C12M]MCY9142818.1 GNAT family N-acetyltransferase [Bacillus sp. T9C1]
MFPVLETDRLTLRQIRDQDAETIFACFSNPEVTRYYGIKSMESKEQAILMAQTFAALYQEKRGIRWGIERRDTKELIGTIGFHALAHKHRRAEIGYEIIPAHWRNGFASEAISKAVSYGFSALGLTRIGAVVFTENEASNRLLVKMGFQKEGVLRHYMYQNGVPYDTNVYSILKSRE